MREDNSSAREGKEHQNSVTEKTNPVANERSNFLQTPLYRFICVLGLLFMISRILQEGLYQNSGLFYVTIPALLGIFMVFAPFDRKVPSHPLEKMRQDLFLATALMLSCATLLQEGWICVLMFMPIFYIGWAIGYVMTAISWNRVRKRKNSKVAVFVAPALALALGMEGVTPQTTVDRYQIVSHTVEVNADVAGLKRNLTEPLTFTGDRHWFLKLFPLPDRIFAGSLSEGDVHKLDFTYWRWVFTHEHRGSVHLKLKEVREDRIITEIVRNTSFYSRYLDIKNTRIDFAPLANGKTKVTLQIAYERKLDPYWYFGPMQHFAMSEAAKVIMNDIIVRQDHE